MRLVMATRDPMAWGVPEIAPYVGLGASPRATLGLLAAGRALAVLRGRRFLVPQDVVDVAPEILRHRLILTYDALAEGVTTDDVDPAGARRRCRCRRSRPARTRRSRPAGQPCEWLRALRERRTHASSGRRRAGRARRRPSCAASSSSSRAASTACCAASSSGVRPGPGSRGRGHARLRRRRRLPLDRLEPDRAFARAADPHDRSRPRAADLGDRRPLGEHGLRHRGAREARGRVRGGGRVRLPHRAARQPLRHPRGRRRPRHPARTDHDASRAARVAVAALRRRRAATTAPGRRREPSRARCSRSSAPGPVAARSS